MSIGILVLFCALGKLYRYSCTMYDMHNFLNAVSGLSRADKHRSNLRVGGILTSALSHDSVDGSMNFNGTNV